MMPNPVLLYYKTAIMRKFVKHGSPLHHQLNEVFGLLFGEMGLKYKDLISNSSTYDEFDDAIPGSMEAFCL